MEENEWNTNFLLRDNSSKMSSYGNVVRGKLSFKGEKPKAVKSSTSSGTSSAAASSSSISGTKRSRESTDDDSREAQGEPPQITILQGVGRITSSGTVVHGHFTEFMRQLKVGDAIIITHPTTYVLYFLAMAIYLISFFSFLEMKKKLK